MPSAAPKPNPLAELIRVEGENEDLRRALRSAQARASKRENQRAEYSKVLRDAVAEARVATPPRVTPPTLTRSKSQHVEVALLHTTDWQYGKRTPSYNPDICERRITETFQRAIKISELQRTDHPVDEIHVMLGGDMVEGVTIFPGQVFEIDADLYTQMFGVANLITLNVRSLLAAFKRVHVWCEYGNHGRIGRRGDLTASDNIDVFAYEIAHRDLSREPSSRLVWHEPIDFYQPVIIGNYHAALIHGDELYRSSAEKSIKDRAHQWAALMRRHDGFSFTDMYVGHLHRMSEYPLETGGAVYITPSPESDNGYARVLLSAQGYPAQRLHFVRPDLGHVTAKYNIYLDGVK